MRASVASTPTGRATFVAVLASTLVVFAAVIGFVTLQTRAGLREQLLQREADQLAAMASMQLATDSELTSAGPGPILPGALFNAVLKASKYRGVFSLRVYDGGRHFEGSFPVPDSDVPPGPDDWTHLEKGERVVRLHRGMRATDVTGVPETEDNTPPLEAWVPLRRAEHGPLDGAAQFWLHGKDVAAEYEGIDRRLAMEAVLAWLAGAVVIALTIYWAFRRLTAANAELLARGEDLQRANRELVLAAKTSALGTVTAHLIHELKNPLAGLEEYVASQAESGQDAATRGEELVAATELTKRLRGMVNDVVGVLRDEQTGATFELTPSEIAQLAVAKAQPEADRAGVKIEVRVPDGPALAARRANLSGLVIRNLLQNAIEASPRGASVHLTAETTSGGSVAFEITDQGGGLAEPIRARLFQPCMSTKTGGSGLGLALSHQLAQQAGGSLDLVRSDASGTSFRLVLPPEA
jgi:signal transduction histidine kinase